ncbi:hypothetical protein MPER_07177 [Moniliophthora perniciosa FA553]|nr:hypothetical protein MPER_07177 [Moniliophthora perniciosa FA553]
MRHLALYWGTYIDVEFIDAFLNICPNLKTLTYGTERDPYNKYSDHGVESSVFDLSSVTTVHDLTFDRREADPKGSRTYTADRQVSRRLYTALDVYSISGLRREHSAYWWTTIDEAMSKLPQDVTLTIIALHPWENNQETEAFIVDNFRKMLPRTQEQSKLKVVTEFAVFPDDDDDDQYLE